MCKVECFGKVYVNIFSIWEYIGAESEHGQSEEQLYSIIFLESWWFVFNNILISVNVSKMLNIKLNYEQFSCLWSTTCVYIYIYFLIMTYLVENKR